MTQLALARRDRLLQKGRTEAPHGLGADVLRESSLDGGASDEALLLCSLPPGLPCPNRCHFGLSCQSMQSWWKLSEHARLSVEIDGVCANLVTGHARICVASR
jgi:hypothetical protein